MRALNKYLLLTMLIVCSCSEDNPTEVQETLNDNCEASVTVRLVPDTIETNECLDVIIKFENTGIDTLALQMHGSYQVWYYINVNDSGSIFFPHLDSYDIYILKLAPGNTIERSVPFCPFRSGNTYWYKIDGDTLATGDYTVTVGIVASNLKCTWPTATLVVK